MLPIALYCVLTWTVEAAEEEAPEVGETDVWANKLTEGTPEEAPDAAAPAGAPEATEEATDPADAGDAADPADAGDAADPADAGDAGDPADAADAGDPADAADAGDATDAGETPEAASDAVTVVVPPLFGFKVVTEFTTTETPEAGEPAEDPVAAGAAEEGALVKITVESLAVEVDCAAAGEPWVAEKLAVPVWLESAEAGQKTVVSVTTPLIVTVWVEAIAPPVGISTEYTVETTVWPSASVVVKTLVP